MRCERLDFLRTNFCCWESALAHKPACAKDLANDSSAWPSERVTITAMVANERTTKMHVVILDAVLVGTTSP